MDWQLLGEVVHYYGKIHVAVVELENDLTVGDWIAFVRDNDLLFEQEVSSIQIEFQNIAEAYDGDTIGLEVQQAVKIGTEVYRSVED